MADQKPKKDRGATNSDRPNRKAWKRRPCGRRHAPKDCTICK